MTYIIDLMIIRSVCVCICSLVLLLPCLFEDALAACGLLEGLQSILTHRKSYYLSLQI